MSDAEQPVVEEPAGEEVGVDAPREEACAAQEPAAEQHDEDEDEDDDEDDDDDDDDEDGDDDDEDEEDEDEEEEEMESAVAQRDTAVHQLLQQLENAVVRAEEAGHCAVCYEPRVSPQRIPLLPHPLTICCGGFTGRFSRDAVRAHFLLRLCETVH